MSFINEKKEGRLLFIFGSEEQPGAEGKHEAAEYDLSCDEELMDDDGNDINGDAENTIIYEARIFYMTHHESSFEIDPSYK